MLGAAVVLLGSVVVIEALAATTAGSLHMDSCQQCIEHLLAESGCLMVPLLHDGRTDWCLAAAPTTTTVATSTPAHPSSDELCEHG